MTTPTPATVLLSGGLDSTVLLHHVARQLGHSPLFVLSFNYGQKHIRELDMARWQAQQVPAVTEHRIIDLGLFREIAGPASAWVGDKMPVPDLVDIPEAQRNQPATYVPNRNMMLLSLAAAYAEARGVDLVYYGAQAQDEYGYWDCTPEFVERLNAVFALNRRQPVRIQAPFSGRRKADLVRLGRELGVDFSRTWSCYRGAGTPCGACPTCVERGNAFREAGIPDPATSSFQPGAMRHV